MQSAHIFNLSHQPCLDRVMKLPTLQDLKGDLLKEALLLLNVDISVESVVVVPGEEAVVVVAVIEDFSVKEGPEDFLDEIKKEVDLILPLKLEVMRKKLDMTRIDDDHQEDHIIDDITKDRVVLAMHPGKVTMEEKTVNSLLTTMNKIMMDSMDQDVALKDDIIVDFSAESPEDRAAILKAAKVVQMLMLAE